MTAPHHRDHLPLDFSTLSPTRLSLPVFPASDSSASPLERWPDAATDALQGQNIVITARLQA